MGSLTPLVLASLLTLTWVPSGEGGKFWHITDIHLDTIYSPSGDRANFCRNSSFGSSVMDSGDYQCDSPLLLFKSAVRAMSLFEPDPEFILWTGDSNPHWKEDLDGKAGPDYPYIWKNLKTIHKILANYFPNATIIPVLGNHDAFPADSFPSYENSTETTNIYTDYLKNGTLGDFITGSSRDTFKKCGYYSRDVVTSKNTNIKLINLNTNIYYNNPLASGLDPCGQLDWLEEELNNAKTSDHVYIAAHVPPGTYERKPDFAFFNSPSNHSLDIHKRFVDILRTPKHAEKIVAHFYGHIHTDTFRLFLDSATGAKARGVAFIASSIVPILWDGRNKSEELPMGSIGTNPGFRLFEFDDSDASLLDYTQYGLDLNSLKENDDKAEESDNKAVNTEVKSRNRNSKMGKKKRQAEIEAQTDSPVVVDSDVNISSQTHNVTEVAETSMTPVPAVPGMIVETNDVKEGVDTDKKQANSSSVNQPRTDDATEATVTEVTVKAIVSEAEPIDSTNEPVTTSDDIISPEDQRVIDLSTKWKFIYNATASFDVQSLSKKEMMRAYKRMVANSTVGIFKRYYKHNTNNHIVDDGDCDPKCQRNHLCAISNFLPDVIAKCLASNDSFHYYHKDQPQPTPAKPTPRQKPLIPTSPASQAPLKPTDPVIDIYDSYSSHHKNSDDKDDDNDDHINHNDHSSVTGHDSVNREPIEDTGSYGTVKGVGIFLGVAGVAILMLIVFVAIRRYRANRYRNQEFLLTDSVFRYDGYNQLDDA